MANVPVCFARAPALSVFAALLASAMACGHGDAADGGAAAPGCKPLDECTGPDCVQTLEGVITVTGIKHGVCHAATVKQGCEETQVLFDWGAETETYTFDDTGRLFGIETHRGGKRECFGRPLAQIIAEQRGQRGADLTAVEQGCGYTALVLSVWAGTPIPEPEVGPPTSIESLQGWMYFFDSRGNLVGSATGSDTSKLICNGTVWKGCGRVTRCGLNLSYPETGELCVHGNDADAKDADAGAAIACEQ